MSRFLAGFLVLVGPCLWCGCEEDSDSAIFTGKSTNYELIDVSSSYQGGGSVIIRERTDGAITIDLQIEPTGSSGLHPAHLHYGTYNLPDSEMAALLNPVDALTGASSTVISQLLDGSSISYAEILEFDGSIKIHLDDGPNKKIVLAAANIGLNAGM